MAINTGKYVEEMNYFLNQVARELGTPNDLDHAGRLIVAVLHTLRDRITIDESMHLISQLPMILKGVYVDGWDISREINRTKTLDEFLDDVRAHIPRSAPRDLGDNQQAKDNVRAVLLITRNYISEGEMQHIREQLPEPIAALFDV